MEPTLIALLLVSAALIMVSILFVRERGRTRALTAELEGERKRSSRTRSPGARAVKAALQTAARVREQGVGGMLMSSIEELAGWAEAEQPELARIAARDGTLTILFSDIEDSTALNEQLGDRAWLKVLGAHDEVVRASVRRHEGHIVKSQGDGFMIAFGKPVEAVRASAEVQRALRSGKRHLRTTPIRVRIGIHTGQAVAKDGDLFGRNVALAARVAARAQGGEILVTAAVSEAVPDEAEFEFVAAREVELKGLPGTHRLCAVEWESASTSSSRSNS